MKVVIVLCVKEYHENLKEIFTKLQVMAYSETDVRGFCRDKVPAEEIPNWFGAEEDYYNSVATFSFMDEDQAEAVLNRVKEFNDTLDCCSPMHGFILNVEKTV